MLTLNEERIESFRHLHERTPYNKPKYTFNRVDVGSYPQHLSLHRTYGSRIRRYIHIGERKL